MPMRSGALRHDDVMAGARGRARDREPDDARPDHQNLHAAALCRFVAVPVKRR